MKAGAKRRECPPVRIATWNLGRPGTLEAEWGPRRYRFAERQARSSGGTERGFGSGEDAFAQRGAKAL